MDIYRSNFKFYILNCILRGGPEKNVKERHIKHQTNYNIIKPYKLQYFRNLKHLYINVKIL